MLPDKALHFPLCTIFIRERRIFYYLKLHTGTVREHSKYLWFPQYLSAEGRFEFFLDVKEN